MNDRTKYNKPTLIDMRSASVVAYTVCSGGYAVETCSQRSCIVSAACGNGVEANGCTNGSSACHPSGCTYSCCYAGSSVEAGISVMCWCSGGTNAGYRCEAGTRASFLCTPTGGAVCA